MPTYKIEMLWRCPACQTENRGRHKGCQHCGRPKTVSDAFYMPGDTSAAAAVTDESLLRHARAGADWSCAYCGSAQRRLDGACLECGAAPTGRATPTSPVSASLGARADAWRKPWWKRAGVWLAAGVVVVSLLLWWVLRTREVTVTVTQVHWEHHVHVDRYQVYHREGFRQDAGAFNVVAMGSRVSHHRQVLDHYDTEHYTERVSCGEDCRTVPETCTTTPRTCTSDNNGFATCSGGDRHCYGGGRECTTRYCDESRTREVPVYRQEPVYAEYYSWDVWDWAHNRTATHRGDSMHTTWPGDDEVRLNADVQGEEKERSQREAKYEVTFTDGDDGQWKYAPKTASAFRDLALGSEHLIRVGVGRDMELLR